MRINKYLFLFPTVAALAVIGGLTAPQMSAAIKAVFVEVVKPNKPFSAILDLTRPVSAGPDAGTLGVTSLTFTNSDVRLHQVAVFEPFLASGNCNTGEVAGGLNSMLFDIPGGATLHFTYPTPLVFSPLHGHTCIAAQTDTVTPAGGAAIVLVSMQVNGFVN